MTQALFKGNYEKHQMSPEWLSMRDMFLASGGFERSVEKITDNDVIVFWSDGFLYNKKTDTLLFAQEYLPKKTEDTTLKNKLNQLKENLGKEIINLQSAYDKLPEYSSNVDTGEKWGNNKGRREAKKEIISMIEILLA